MTAIIEVAHAYLEEIDDGARVTNRTVEATERLVDRVDNALTLIVIDDITKSDRWVRDTASFEAQRERLTQKYLTGFDPDFTFYESEFTPVIDDFLEFIPMITEDDLTDPDAWGLRLEGNTGTLYGVRLDGEREKATIIRKGPDSNKTTRYTCAMYDTAILLSKFGISRVATPIEPPADLAVTVHREGYIGSEPHARSKRIQTILRKVGYLPTIEHIEVDGPEKAIDGAKQ